MVFRFFFTVFWLAGVCRKKAAPPPSTAAQAVSSCTSDTAYLEGTGLPPLSLRSAQR